MWGYSPPIIGGHMYDTTKQIKWFEILDLALLCPAEVPELTPTSPTKATGQSKSAKAAVSTESDKATKSRKRCVDPGMVQIKGSTRMLLFAFAKHADGKTNETWISRRKLLVETATTINTLDSAIAELKRAGLLRIRKDFDESRGTFRHIWILQRDRLAALAGEQVDEKLIIATVTAAINDGSSSIECSRARVEQTRSALYVAAGSTRISINDVALENGMTKLVVTTGDVVEIDLANLVED